MEPGLPVWTIRPNWAGGITERLEWLTDVIQAETSGDEQRRSIRPTPRRYVEITVNPVRQERSYLDLLLHNVGSPTWLVPLWFDKARLSASTLAGATRVEFDNAYREHGMGDFVLLYSDAFTWEVLSVDSSDDTGLNLIDPVAAPWPKGTVVYPLRRAKLPSNTAIAALTSRVGEGVLLWQTMEANDYPATVPTDALFESVPVLNVPPNRSEEITLEQVRLSVDLDNQISVPYRVDPVGRAFSVQSHNWQVKGRQAHAEFRSFLYWLRGRQRSLWVPTFNDDVIAARASASGSLNLDIEKIGMAYAGGPVAGRNVLWLNGKGARITAMGAAQAAGQERLRIGAGLGGAVAIGDHGSFMEIARLNQDSIELTHHTDTDGVMEVAATFQSFSNNRDPSGTIYTPIPESAQVAGTCGSLSDRVTLWRYLPVAVNDLTTDRAARDFNDSGWAQSTGPFGNNTVAGFPPPIVPLSPRTGCWFRCTVGGGIRSFRFGQDDVADVWYNGVKVGGTYQIGSRTIALPAPDGDNNILAVRVRDTVGTYIRFADGLNHI